MERKKATLEWSSAVRLAFALLAPKSPAAPKVNVPGVPGAPFETAAAFGPPSSPAADRSNSGARTSIASKLKLDLRRPRACKRFPRKNFLTITKGILSQVWLSYPHTFQSVGK